MERSRRILRFFHFPRLLSDYLVPFVARGRLSVLLVALYQLRLRQVARHFNIRMEERVNERIRIARDLHDTLLQSFQGVLMKFSVVTYQLRDRPEEAWQAPEKVIEQARQAVTEGRVRCRVALLHGDYQRPCPGDQHARRRARCRS